MGRRIWHYGVGVEEPLTGVYNPNYLEWLGDEVAGAIDLGWERFIAEENPSEEEMEHFESTGPYLIGYKRVTDENGEEVFVPDEDAEWSAILECDEYLQVVRSRWAVKCALCSPCYPGQGDGDSEGEYIAYAPPPAVVGELNPELRARIFELNPRWLADPEAEPYAEKA